MYITGGDHSPFDYISTTFLSDAKTWGKTDHGSQPLCVCAFLSTQDCW
jgi:hypothetical protein